jgi:hypothetical protein
MNRAVDLGDWGRARSWSDRVARTLEQECGLAEPHHSLQCEERAYELRDVSSRLVALGLSEPRSWEDAMTAAAWTCHLEAGPHRGVSRTTATWTGTEWTFAEWDVPSGTTECLDAVRTTVAVPDEPTQVRLTLEGSP